MAAYRLLTRGLTALLLFGGGGTALASDMALRGSVPAFDAAPIAEWSGFYGGAMGGIGAMRIDTQRAGANAVRDYLTGLSFVDGTPQSTAVADTLRLRTINQSPTVLGAFAGYQIQYEDAVIGFEIDYVRLLGRNGATVVSDPINLVFSQSGLQDIVSPTTSLSASVSDIFTARARFGWALGRIMPYATVGVALVRGSSTQSYSATCIRNDTDPGTAPAWGPGDCVGARAPVTFGAANRFGVGLVGGGGIEALITRNLFLRGEYLFTSVPSVAGVPFMMHQFRAGLGLKL